MELRLCWTATIRCRTLGTDTRDVVAFVSWLGLAGVLEERVAGEVSAVEQDSAVLPRTYGASES